MEILNKDELEKLYTYEKNEKEMYKQALFELFDVTSYIMLKEVPLSPEEVKKRLLDIGMIIGIKEENHDSIVAS